MRSNRYLPRLLVIVLAVIVYLLLLPLDLSGGIRLPNLVTLDAAGVMSGPDPINWRYLLILPVSLLVIVVGFEIIRLTERNH